MQVIMINKYKNLIFVAFKIVIPYLKDFNNCSKLTIIDFILTIYKNHFF